VSNYDQGTGSTADVIGVIGCAADFIPKSPVISDGQWHSVLVTYNGTTVRIYIDQVLTSVVTQNT